MAIAPLLDFIAMTPKKPISVENRMFRDEFTGRHRVFESVGVSSIFS